MEFRGVVMAHSGRALVCLGSKASAAEQHAS